jgi:hypothetical protein
MAIDERGLNGDQIPPFIIIGSYLNHHYICCYTLIVLKQQNGAICLTKT